MFARAVDHVVYYVERAHVWRDIIVLVSTFFIITQNKLCELNKIKQYMYKVKLSLSHEEISSKFDFDSKSSGWAVT